MCEPLYFYRSTCPQPSTVPYLGASGLWPQAFSWGDKVVASLTRHTCSDPPAADLQSSGPCPPLTRESVSCSRSGAEPHSSSLAHLPAFPHPSLPGSPCPPLRGLPLSVRDSSTPPLVLALPHVLAPSFHRELLPRVVYTYCSPHFQGPTLPRAE